MANRLYKGRVDFLANNAGMGMKCSWEDTTAFSTTFNTNIMGVVNGVSSVLTMAHGFVD